MTGNQRLQTAIRPPLAKRVVYRVKTVHVRPGDADGLLDLGKIIRQYPHPGVLTGCRLQRLADAGDHIPFTGEEGVDCLPAKREGDAGWRAADGGLAIDRMRRFVRR